MNTQPTILKLDNPSPVPLIKDLSSKIPIILGHKDSIGQLLSIKREQQPYKQIIELGTEVLGNEKAFYDWLITPNGYLNTSLITSNSAEEALLKIIQIKDNPYAMKPIDLFHQDGGFDFMINYFRRLEYGDYSV